MQKWKVKDMDMQDKEFDSLFRSKLENFKAEPTSQVWLGITERLDGKQRYRTLLPWLSIAASITILAAAGILFIPQKKPAGVKHPAKNAIVKTRPPVMKPEPVIRQAESKTSGAREAPPVNQLVHVKAKPVNQAIKVHEAAAVIENAGKHNEQSVLAVVEQKPEPISPVLPSDATPIITRPLITDSQASTQSITAATVPAAGKQEADQPKPKRKVHGIGGFLNTVIAAVDKRKDKIIEFSNSDDDESSNISAVNLGILKFKRDKEK
ncbi:hypothetical protein [Mucilaginibacter sp. L3T2-6]|uniref:hypothetical protein n=1 Tax=Mucilaginibacter sp. L3T2-6 TaxID=3062491 RepID=UPI002675271A|nr:hypothetical protein [Mucilaginibacter sp. L3T2-6]MDO3641916.1 hypothetical protein [Mucilaginibacter sp. L3T2-6]MDV6214406.1 hypothetical protein [Mucilaginibacter sp. L3T2-6]